MFESIIKDFRLCAPTMHLYFQHFHPNLLASISYVLTPNTNGAERPHHWCAGSTPF